MTFFTDDQIKELIKQKNLKTAEDVQDMLKEMFGKTLEQMLEAELENELGYSKYNYKDKKTNNSRNGHTKKKVRSDFGEIDLTIPRDRNSEFEPVVVKKHQKDVSGIEDQIISMYAKGMTVRDIQEHLNNIYGIEASPTLISNITDKLLPVIKEWQNRPLIVPPVVKTRKRFCKLSSFPILYFKQLLDVAACRKPVRGICLQEKNGADKCCTLQCTG